jgi:KDO2-lipid IV(A) lauroyltransferase
VRTAPLHVAPPRRPSRDPSPDARRRRRWLRAARNALLARSIAAAAAILGLLPLRMALAVGRALGAGAHRVLGRDRRLALEHLALAFPELDPARRAWIARETFRNIGCSFAELAHWRTLHRRLDRTLTIEGLEHAQRALADGRGLIAVTGHVGNWELLAAGVAHLGYSLTVVARRVNDDRFDRLIAAFRGRMGVRTILRDDADSLREITGTLRRGGILALLVDQDTRGPGVFVPFFGRPAWTAPGAAILALRTRAPVVAAFIERRGVGHHLRIEPLLGGGEAESAELRPSVEELTARFTAAVERQIRRQPTEWVWWHRRWRRQPGTPAPRLERSA